MNLIRILFHVLLLTAFAMWFGGFFFYVSFVVPIGTEILGSAFDQGMITRRVTIPLNYLGGAAAALMLVNSFASWKRTHSPLKHIQLAATFLILGLLACLFIVHPKIDAFVDLQSGEIRGDYDQFYFLHRIYLWSSTFQWIASFVWLFCYISIFARKPKAPPSMVSNQQDC